jgi:hypothetical protein
MAYSFRESFILSFPILSVCEDRGCEEVFTEEISALLEKL